MAERANANTSGPRIELRLTETTNQIVLGSATHTIHDPPVEPELVVMAEAEQWTRHIMTLYFAELPLDDRMDIYDQLRNFIVAEQTNHRACVSVDVEETDDSEEDSDSDTDTDEETSGMTEDDVSPYTCEWMDTFRVFQETRRLWEEYTRSPAFATFSQFYMDVVHNLK